MATKLDPLQLTLPEIEILVYAITRAGGEKVLGHHAESVRRKAIQIANAERRRALAELREAEVLAEEAEEGKS